MTGLDWFRLVSTCFDRFFLRFRLVSTGFRLVETGRDWLTLVSTGFYWLFTCFDSFRLVVTACDW